ncbi:4872_t:CDS:2, partial [Gigaspora rosea]
KEKQSIIEIKDSDKLVTIERIMKTSEEEKLKIIKTQEAAQREVEQHKQSKLCMEDMCSVRGGLEFIRSKIFSNSNSSNFEEPVDKALLKLSDDKKFLKFLKKSCDDNFLRLDDVIKCMSGLYHTASKGFHGHKQITINAHEQTWSSNEIFSLGVLFEFFKIPWEYYDVDGRNYAYKISH